MEKGLNLPFCFHYQAVKNEVTEIVLLRLYFQLIRKSTLTICDSRLRFELKLAKSLCRV